MTTGDLSTHRPPQDVVLLLRSLIHRQTGIHFENQWLDMLVEKIRPLVQDRDASLLEYYFFLKYDSTPEAWNQLINALSVQETYFWREFDQIQALVDQVVPDWFNRTDQPLRIWSAACATGEEPLSIAMALQEAGWGSHPIKILASDASESALRKAKAGLYRERSFRALPASLHRKYFTPEGDRWRVSPDLASQITFRQANLVVPAEIEDLVTSPIIFCRNVFIYFSSESILRALSLFAQGMPKNGYLFVGVAESLLNLTTDFQLAEIGNSFVYKRSIQETI